MTSAPPDPCCYSGVQLEREPQAEDSEIDGNVAYIATPQDKDKATRCEGKGIIYLSDVGGIWHNSRILADQYAAAGYLTVIPNKDDKVRPEGAEREDTISTALTTAQKKGTIASALTYLEAQGCSQVAAVGYCAGARSVVSLLARQSELVKVGFIAHPAGVTRKALETIKGPISIAAAEEDHLFTKARRTETEAVLKDLDVPFQINLYSHVRHGFAVRRAVTTRAEIFAKQQAFIQAITFIEEHLFNKEG